MTKLKFEYQIRYCLIHSAHLPIVTVVVGVTMEPLEEDKKVGRKCVLLVKRFGVFDSVAT